jgi:hypothetical protein
LSVTVTDFFSVKATPVISSRDRARKQLFLADGDQARGRAVGIGGSSTAYRRALEAEGLGLVLLQSGLRALWQRGHTHVGLEADSENETGATRLYERAGMRVTRRYAT